MNSSFRALVARRRCVVHMTLVGAALIAGCAGPTPPAAPTRPNTPPVVRSVTPKTTDVEAGEEVEMTAIVEDAETPLELLQYSWSAEAGTFSGQGKIVRWKSPTDGPVPRDYTIHVTIMDAHGAATTGTSAAIRVNDAIREMRQLALTFLLDFTDIRNSPEYCVRNFTDSCPGKAFELGDIRANRRDFDEILNLTPPLIKFVERNSGTLRCSYPSVLGGRQVCALLVAGVDWRSRFASSNTRGGVPGSWIHVVGDAILTGVFERKQWWLCDSNFEGETLPTLKQPFLR